MRIADALSINFLNAHCGARYSWCHVRLKVGYLMYWVPATLGYFLLANYRNVDCESFWYLDSSLCKDCLCLYDHDNECKFLLSMPSTVVYSKRVWEFMCIQEAIDETMCIAYARLVHHHVVLVIMCTTLAILLSDETSYDLCIVRKMQCIGSHLYNMLQNISHFDFNLSMTTRWI